MSADHRQWLQDFATNRSETAFAALVRAHLDLVYSAARRIAAGDTHLAEDITQTVFADLARKAARLPGDVILSGWLYRHTFFVASSMIRRERRRRDREQEAVAMNTLPETAEPEWSTLAPHLDAAMNELSDADRLALVLRYFDKLDLRAVGERLGVSEDTAQKRVARALDKLRHRFTRQNVSVSLTALAATLLANAVTAAPAFLIAKTASVVIAGTVAGTGLIFTLERFLSMNALKPLAAALAIAGVATPLIMQQQSLAALRRDQAALTERAGQVDQLRTENDRLAKLAVDARELEELRKEHLELMRLRGESTLMRNQLDELKRELERQRQLLAAKGASAEELLSEAERQANRQIMIESRFVELPLDSAIWAEFGLRQPASVMDSGTSHILNQEKAMRLIKRLKETEGVDVMFAPLVSTKNGRQAQAKTVDVQTVVTGKTDDGFKVEAMEFGPSLDLIPTLAKDSQDLHLTVNANVIQFLGYDKPDEVIVRSTNGSITPLAQDTPLPRFRNQQLQANAVLGPGHVLVLTTGHLKIVATRPGGFEEELVPTREGLLVIVSPREIDAAGGPVSPGAAFAPTSSPPSSTAR